ncbi:biotin transporter BioY [Anaeromyxobacter dehalogenans]|uniref:Biotin transporter n=1 Tax=Anaeromyxobacter dehalogenans (strain 2CP-C) TaxID=290397 RepID=Q2IND4_ANADE|nr:biotin transporter BioY [Anaeromyxobacter dehalogenans]ABC80315.1 BioY protein [Anaeromyxobacter dehalogenans 2CP-C]
MPAPNADPAPPRPAPSPPLARVHRLVWTALLAACIAVGAWIQVPVGAVPITLQPLFAFLAGYLLGPARGAAAVALYVAAGVLGLPVFAGGAAGLGVVLGPTGGYLLGFVVAAALTGLVPRRGPIGWGAGLAAGAAALAAAYVIGAAWLAAVLHLGARQAIVAGVVPFLPFDVVKVVVALWVARRLRAQGLAPA